LTHQVRLLSFPSIDYMAAWEWQRIRCAGVRAGGPEAFALLQHPPVYTFGRLARHDHLLIDPGEVRHRGAEVVESDRGGDITFHGPGQLVGYPILDLRRHGLGPNAYVHSLEETLIRALAGFDLSSYRISGRPGVWAGGAKVAAVGVRVQGGVTTHGFALNVSTDLSWFDAIVPCGISDASVTSMEHLLAARPGMDAVEAAVVDAFAGVFDVELLKASAADADLEPSHGR
jgi:lipoate-protein ligase B